MSNYSLIFYAKKTKGNPENSAIYLRITIKGQRAEISTGQTISTSSWNSQAGKVSGSGIQAKTINSYLDNLRLKILQCYNELLNSFKEITSTTLKNRFLGIDERKVTIVEVFKDHNKQMYKLIGKSFVKGTWNDTKHLCAILLNF